MPTRAPTRSIPRPHGGNEFIFRSFVASRPLNGKARRSACQVVGYTLSEMVKATYNVRLLSGTPAPTTVLTPKSLSDSR